ncbi:MAG: hypothetical protein JRN67_12550 [Nitrososphaerota archaeon]|jgi:hypothetical protein|nr:hypothetical protein [Nitrososphaerota archaeon]
MIFIQDDGIFDATLDKIMRLHSSSEHKHPSTRNMRPEHAGGNVLYMSGDMLKPDGKTWESVKAKLTSFPPIGHAFEFQEGHLAGSKDFTYYTPLGNDQTKVVTVGYWTSNVLSGEEELKEFVLKMFETFFEEDQANLARMK